MFGFLSEYEGFGLTPLEALAAGVPIVVLDTPVAREVYGDAAEYVAVDDEPGTAAALRRFLTSPRPPTHNWRTRRPSSRATRGIGRRTRRSSSGSDRGSRWCPALADRDA